MPDLMIRRARADECRRDEPMHVMRAASAPEHNGKVAALAPPWPQHATIPRVPDAPGVRNLVRKALN